MKGRVMGSNVYVRNLVIGLGLMMLGAPATGQSHRIRFDHLDLTDGLSQMSGNAVLQDSRGFIWIGTEDGLNRFDGYHFEVFRHDPDDPASIPDNYIRRLFEDANGRLWILFNQPGVMALFDFEAERFERLQHDPNDPGTLPLSFITSGVPADDGSYWIGTADSGIAKLDPGTLRSTPLRHDPQDPQSLASDRVSTITKTRDGTLWIATQGALHRRLSPDNGRERFETFFAGSRESPGPEPSTLGGHFRRQRRSFVDRQQRRRNQPL